MRSKLDPGVPSLRRALRPVHFALAAAAVFSLGINLLMLVAPLYLMQVFDRVLTGANLDTLFWLTVVAVGSLAVYGALETVRGRILAKIGLWLEESVTGRLIRVGMDEARRGSRDGVRPLRDLAQVRSFLSGPAIHALFDAPWSPVFVAVLALMHPWYGLLAAGSVAVLLALAIAGELMTRERSRKAADAHANALFTVDSALRNAETAHAMGMVGAILARWRERHDMANGHQDRLNDRAALLTGLSKFIRMSVQIGVVALGAVLVLGHEITTGALIAASILLGRALAPVDQAIGSWKQIAVVRAAWRRVDQALAAVPTAPEATRLQAPQGRVSVENVVLRAPDDSAPLLNNVSFELHPGESLGIVGPSAAGKSLLCRVLAGIVTPTLGSVRVDHAEIGAWHPDDLRPHIGYLPQDIALFPGTVGENIARMADAESKDIVAAAQRAGVHEMILRLPHGYQTDVGAFGHLLSGGQRQRIALARALFGAPKLVILDEPNSNLDPAGEAALFAALEALKRDGCTVVVVSHKLGIVRRLDDTLLLRDGTVQAFGPSREVLPVLMADGRPQNIAAPPHVLPAAG